MAPKILLRFAATLLLATAVVTQFEQARADDPCADFDLACTEDTDCTTCRDAVGSNVAGYEECQLNYGIFDDDQCVIQAAAACCQNEATSVDCLANAAYMNFYDCRLQNDVGGDCTGLSCDAVGTAIFETPAPADADVDANPDDAAEDEDVDTASENAAGLVAPSSLTSGISAVSVMAGLLAGAMKVL